MQLTQLNIDDALPEREHTPSNVSLFLYNAAVWNAHRIHYDETYTTTVENHPGVVIDGPLQGDWLAQCVTNWLGDDGVLERQELAAADASSTEYVQFFAADVLHGHVGQALMDTAV